MQSTAHTIDEYLSSLPEDRRQALAAVRQMIRKNLPDGFEEGMQYGMIGYYVPLSRYPVTYNGQALGYVALASQKNYMALYLTSVYADEQTSHWFQEQYRASGKKLDMGKSCVRFKKLEDLPLALIGKTVGRTSVDELIRMYEQSRHMTRDR